MFFNSERKTISIGMSQDQHVFHKRIGVDRPLDALRRAFPDDERTGELACLFYNGDFWDHEVPYTHPELPKVHEYIGWRLKSASKRGYSVRVLDGTDSHDRGQSLIWESINNALQQPADFKYIDTVCIESHPILGDILYVPDNWKPTTDEVWEDVCLVMKEKNVTMVDWVMFHGAFKHQLPEYLHNRIQLHDSDRYSSICRKYVLAGHVHLKSQYKNIISIGSIERLSHNEEEPKGTLRINCTPQGDEILFQENVMARICKTIELIDMPAEEAYATIMDELKQFNPGQLEDMSIRLKARKTDHAYFMLAKLIQDYPTIDWSFADVDQKTKLHLIRSETLDVPETSPIDFSPKAVKDELIKRIGSDITASMVSKIDEIFLNYR